MVLRIQFIQYLTIIFFLYSAQQVFFYFKSDFIKFSRILKFNKLENLLITNINYALQVCVIEKKCGTYNIYDYILLITSYSCDIYA